MTEAQFYTQLENNAVGCNLCPRNCIIEAGKFGNCKARRNRNGTLISEVYGKIAALNSDPVEKNHYTIFSRGMKSFRLEQPVVTYIAFSVRTLRFHSAISDNL